MVGQQVLNDRCVLGIDSASLGLSTCSLFGFVLSLTQCLLTSRVQRKCLSVSYSLSLGLSALLVLLEIQGVMVGLFLGSEMGSLLGLKLEDRVGVGLVLGCLLGTTLLGYQSRCLGLQTGLVRALRVLWLDLDILYIYVRSYIIDVYT